MQKKVVLALATAILAVSILAGFIFSEKPNSNAPLVMQNIIIRPDGSITPADAPITRSGDTYTFTADIYGTIKIQRSNVILDGVGYTLRGPYNGSQANVWVVGDGPNQSPDLVAEYIIGVDLGAKTVEGVTVQNLNVKNFSIGMYMWTRNDTVRGCSVKENIVGVLLSGLNNTVTYNYLENNRMGLFLGFNNEGDTSIPSDIVIHHNDFENNEVQLNGCRCKDLNVTETPHHWDDGREGNYWSDYSGVDGNGDGVGDTPYTVDILNIDRYPLMRSPVIRSTPAP